MIHILWEFRVRNEKREEFERHYGPQGSWAKLFAQAKGYRGTKLLRDRVSGRYLTIDEWESAESFESFKEVFEKEYAELDGLCEKLTEEEKRVGLFEEI